LPGWGALGYSGGRMSSYRTTPQQISGMPSGIPHIIGNELAERFSFYGMKAILVAFMTQAMVDRAGNPDLLNKEQATEWFHYFVFAVYITPLIGGLIADLWLGKYRTIILLSLVYCLGHAALAVDSTRLGLMIGLGLIALGSGGIKPCVSAHVGDQFAVTNKHLVPRVYYWFYLSINIGSAISILLTPWLLEEYGPHVAFAVPGVLMVIATIVFWMGRHRFAHIQPDRAGFVAELRRPEVLRSIAGLLVIYSLVAMFWSLFDQTHSRWVLQAEHMNRNFLGWEILPSQLQSANPILVLILVPFFSLVVYPLVGRFVELTPLRKIGAGFFLAVTSFMIPAWVETWIAAGERPNILWQIGAYVLITSAEVLISITCLEFSYTQAPPRLKSFVMSLFLASVALGNLFTAIVNGLIDRAGGEALLSGASYYWFFVKCMAGTAVVYVIVALFYKGGTYLQGGDDKTAVGK
jgi:proton-dependent oligopeptide transporter, POT family